MFKISIYAIMKNEAANIRPFVEQFVPYAHRIVLLDTGSTDNSVQLAESLKDEFPAIEVHQADIRPFNFSIARNMAMEIAQRSLGIYDLLMWADLDERISDKWYETLASTIIDYDIPIDRKFHCLKTTMKFSDTVTYTQSKIHSARGFYWKYACHELLLEKDKSEYALTSIEFTHHPDPKKPRNYIELLRDQYFKNGTDLRCAHYYARELFYKDDFAECYAVLHDMSRFTEMVDTAQMIDSYMLRSFAERQLGIDNESTLYKALALDINHIEVMLYLAYSHYYKDDAIGILFWTDRMMGAALNKSKNVIYNKNNELLWQAYDLNGKARSELGDYEGAARSYAHLIMEFKQYVPQEDLVRISENIHWLASMQRQTK